MTVPKNVFILSDSTGDTASRIVRAALKQFVGQGVRVRRFPNVLRKSEIRGILRDASAEDALVAHTFAATPLRLMMRQEASEHGVENLDLLGPLLDSLERHLHRKPAEEPGLYHKIDEQYFRRIDAVEFAVMHDDGKHLDGLKHADLVLLGVSRTARHRCRSTSPSKGGVGNVPLVKGQKVPPQILELPPERLVGLMIDPRRLAEIRRSRMDYMAPGHQMAYDDARAVRDELNWSRRVLQKHGVRIVDVTQRAIEETAHLVLKAVGQEGIGPPGKARTRKKA